MPPLHLKARERLDKLTGTKLKVGYHKVKVLNRIAEGGHAFVYLASVSDKSSTPTPTILLHNDEALVDEDGYNKDNSVDMSTNSSFDGSVALSDFDSLKMGDIDDLNSSHEAQEGHNINSKSTPKKKWGVFKKMKSKKKCMVVLKATSVDDSEKCKRSLVEVDILRTLSAHRNIISLIDSGFSVSHNSTQVRDLMSGSVVHSRRTSFRRIHYTLLEHCVGGSLMSLILKRRKMRRTNLNSSRQDQASSLHTGLFTGHSATTDDDLVLITGSDYESSNGVSTCSSNSRSKNTATKKKFTVSLARPDFPSTRTMSCTAMNILTPQEPVVGAQHPGYLDLNDVLAIFRQVVDALSFMHNRGDGMTTNHATDSNNENDLPPIIHRDLKPDNILLVNDSSMTDLTDQDKDTENINVLIRRKRKQWQIRLCDFGSAAIGTMPVGNREERNAAHEMIKTSTTQMYRAPEMVDLHLSNELSEKTDIWALGCTLYATCFLKNCFEENENLSIIAGNYKIPDDHPYGYDMEELIKRMLTLNPCERPCINEVSDCLDAMQHGHPLPPSRAHGVENVIAPSIAPFWNEESFNISRKSARKIPTYIHTSTTQRNNFASPLKVPSTAVTLKDSTLQSTNNVNICKESLVSSSGISRNHIGSRSERDQVLRNDKNGLTRKNKKNISNKKVASGAYGLQTTSKGIGNRENISDTNESFSRKALDFDIDEEDIFNRKTQKSIKNKKSASGTYELETISKGIGNRENIPDRAETLLRKAIDFETEENGILKSPMRPRRPPLSSPGKIRNRSLRHSESTILSPPKSIVASDILSPALTPSSIRKFDYETQMKSDKPVMNSRDRLADFNNARRSKGRMSSDKITVKENFHVSLDTSHELDGLNNLALDATMYSD